jgi:dGTPase
MREELGAPMDPHVGEEELCKLADDNHENDGFDGNAQSFRIITKLAVRSSKYAGLNLTAASLNGVLKYPSNRGTKGEEHRKWGAYHGESVDFNWARTVMSVPGKIRTPEAELMDWADDIAYSVFDVDDFYRAGLIPLDQIFADQAERERFLANATARLKKWKKDADAITAAFKELVANFPPRSLRGHFEGTSEQRALLRDWTSRLVARYVDAITLQVPPNPGERTVAILPELKNEVESLKQLVWHYVIENPRLLTQQHGQRTIIKNLFNLFLDMAKSGKHDIFPQPYRQMLRDGEDDDGVRTVIDMISAMTEPQAVKLHQRLLGISMGSIHDHID